MKCASIFLLSLTVIFLPAMEVGQKEKRNVSLFDATKNIMVIAPKIGLYKSAEALLAITHSGFNYAARIAGIDVDTILKENK